VGFRHGFLRKGGQGSRVVRKPIRITALLLGVLICLGMSAFVAYRASQQVPDFYEQALKAAPEIEKAASDAMIQRAMTLASEVREPGSWEAVFTTEQINGWLAVDLPRNYPDSLPPNVRDPRVAIKPRQLRVACRYQGDHWSTVLSLAADVYLAAPNVIAVRIHGARAGRLPLPLQKILEQIAQETARLDLHVRWTQAAGDPVAEISIAPRPDSDGKTIRVESLELGDGELYLAGTTEP